MKNSFVMTGPEHMYSIHSWVYRVWNFYLIYETKQNIIYSVSTYYIPILADEYDSYLFLNFCSTGRDFILSNRIVLLYTIGHFMYSGIPTYFFPQLYLNPSRLSAHGLCRHLRFKFGFGLCLQFNL